MSQEFVIPDEYVDLCKQVAKLCAKANLNRASFQFTPGYDSTWHDPIQMNWDSGRHGGDMGEVRINSTVQINTKVELDYK